MQLSIFYLYEESRIRDAVTKIADGIYEHTNSRGRTKQYRVYSSFNEFKKSGYYNGFRMERVMGFYIVVI